MDGGREGHTAGQMKENEERKEVRKKGKMKGWKKKEKVGKQRENRTKEREFWAFWGHRHSV